MTEKPIPTPGGSDELDCYCDHCGYNLRGQSGDRRQCPECGAWNVVGQLRATQDAMARAAKTGEYGALACLTAVTVVGIFVWANFEAMYSRGAWNDKTGVSCFLGTGLICFIVWLAGASAFSQACGERSGWPAALLQYHLLGLSAVVLIVGIYALAITLLESTWRWAFGPSWAEFIYLITMPILALAAIWIILWLIRPRHQKWRRKMEETWKEVAAHRVNRK